MYLGDPSLPISVDEEKAKQLVEQALKKRNWKEVSIEETKLVLVPYYLFDYVSYSEKEHHGEQVVEEVEKGRLVINPETMEVMQGIADSLDESSLTNEISSHEEFEIRKPKLKGKNAEKICQLKTAQLLERPAEKVMVEKVKLFYIPLWEIKAKFHNQEALLLVSAVSENVLEEEKLPFREKTNADIVNETLEELQNPKAWVRYTKELIELAAKGKTGGPGVFSKIGGNWLWIITAVLLIILIIVVLLP